MMPRVALLAAPDPSRPQSRVGAVRAFRRRGWEALLFESAAALDADGRAFDLLLVSRPEEAAELRHRTNRVMAWPDTRPADADAAVAGVLRLLALRPRALASAPPPRRRVKLIWNWGPSRDLCRSWNRMSQGDYRWNDLEFTWEDQGVDYYAMFNGAAAGERFDPSRTVLFQMEPRMAEEPERWGEWSRPDPRRFLETRAFAKARGVAEWHLGKTYRQLRTEPIAKTGELSAVVSSRTLYPGHRKRIEMLRHLEARGFDYDLFGRDNQHGFSAYRGALPPHNKNRGILPYRYTFAAENHSAPFYFTEKIVDAILGECLCFYWGCPNLERFLDPEAFVRVDLDDPASAYARIRAAIEGDEWSRRLPAIRRAKEEILERLQVFPTLQELLDRHEERARRRARRHRRRDGSPGPGLFTAFEAVFCINLARARGRWRRVAAQFREHRLEVDRVEAVDGATLRFADLAAKGWVAEPFVQPLPGALGLIATTVGLWSRIAASPEGWYLILEDDCRFHPALRDPEFGARLWRSVPPDAELVYLGCQSPRLGETPEEDESTLLEFAEVIDPHCVRLRRSVQGTCAYAIRPETARRLLAEYLPLRHPLDYIPADRFRQVAMRRLDASAPLPTPPGFYQDRATWSGTVTVQMHGAVSTFQVPSTIRGAAAGGAVPDTAGVAARALLEFGSGRTDWPGLYEAGRALRRAGRHEAAWLLLAAARSAARGAPSEERTEPVRDIELPDELSVASWYCAAPGRQAVGFEALRDLVDTAGASTARTAALRSRAPRLRANCRFWGESPLRADHSRWGSTGTPNLAIVCADRAGEPWDPETMRRHGMGGSEEAVAYAAESLARHGALVTVYATPPEDTLHGFPPANPRFLPRALFADHCSAGGGARFDAVVVWRDPHVPDAVLDAGRRRLLWLHDVLLPGAATSAALDRFDRVLWLSRFQYETAGGADAVPEERCLFTANGIVPEQFSAGDDDLRRDPYRCVYASSYARGLEVLLDAWPRAKERFPAASLDIYYGWQTWLPMPAGWEEGMRRRVASLAPLDVREHGRIGHERLARELQGASFWTYPCTVPETFCITGLKAQRAGCVPVVVRGGALAETVIDGFHCDRPEEYADLLLAALARAADRAFLDPLRRRLRDWGARHSWDAITSRWLEALR
jgi:glycosyltransferase involved in cell wall biosynthesis/GR25 family glycosyltransferase involved in LPS biosynthesis